MQAFHRVIVRYPLIASHLDQNSNLTVDMSDCKDYSKEFLHFFNQLVGVHENISVIN